MTDVPIQLSNAQWFALSDLVAVKGRRIFAVKEMGAVADSTLRALEQKGAIVHLPGGRVRVTDAGAEAVLRVQRLYDRQGRG